MDELISSGGGRDFRTFAAQHQPNPKAAEYQRYMTALQSKLESNDPAVKALRDQMNAKFIAMRGGPGVSADIGPTTVHQNSTLSNVSIQYANDEYIGDRLMPIVQVSKKSDVYYIYDKRNRLAYPDSRLGPRGQANEISESRSTSSYLCEGHGFENYVDQETLNNQDAPLNEMVDLTEAIAEGLAFKRELAQAAILCTSANYGSNTSPVAAADRWDVPTGNPIPAIKTAIAACWQGRGPGALWGFTSLDVYDHLSANPFILDLFKYGGTAPGLATPQMLAGFFGLAGLLVGKARKDTANETATASYSRIWSNVFGVVRVAARPSVRNAAFGYTFRNGPLRTTTWFDQRPGVAGGYFGKVTESRDEKIVAADTGYLLTTPID